ncbi:chromatin-remodeling complex subunit ies6 [Malassezia sp. CBS 17886]|nr:chromatin-remodeling complex subunit ies6 [Malassezia sp. CBS 17886]
MSATEWTSEDLSVMDAARPFKSAEYAVRSGAGAPRRNKTLKQILTGERDAQLQRLGLADGRSKKKASDQPGARKKRLTGAAAVAARRRHGGDAPSTPDTAADDDTESPSAPATEDVSPDATPSENARTVTPAVECAAAQAPQRDMPSYASVEAPPSLLPMKRYCDITGLVGPYTDPKTRLRYHSVEVYDIIRGLVWKWGSFFSRQGAGVDNTYLALRGDASQLL